MGAQVDGGVAVAGDDELFAFAGGLEHGQQVLAELREEGENS
ncbi:MAG TPA: hypothetical protein VH253_16995 [Phycisphaerae bacterium]|nr:hypothetical protein [Phycisphaerae bacterium]